MVYAMLMIAVMRMVESEISKAGLIFQDLDLIGEWEIVRCIASGEHLGAYSPPRDVLETAQLVFTKDGYLLAKLGKAKQLKGRYRTAEVNGIRVLESESTKEPGMWVPDWCYTIKDGFLYVIYREGVRQVSLKPVPLSVDELAREDAKQLLVLVFKRVPPKHPEKAEEKPGR
uniref:Lipocalin-like domain-containing protein n=1 Tax=uncultured Planctomycetota bacterium TaxID=120965 RepID=H5SCB1_9BACT|nr:hypothetical protein HGMM_F08F10C16 [uncultured Planctomycetota bacterium]